MLRQFFFGKGGGGAGLPHPPSGYATDGNEQKHKDFNPFTANHDNSRFYFILLAGEIIVLGSEMSA